MTETMSETFPKSVTWTEPVGNVCLGNAPKTVLLHGRVQCRTQRTCAVLPGIPFYVDGGGTNTMRLNFSNSRDELIIAGVERLGRVLASQV